MVGKLLRNFRHVPLGWVDLLVRFCLGVPPFVATAWPTYEREVVDRLSDEGSIVKVKGKRGLLSAGCAEAGGIKSLAGYKGRIDHLCRKWYAVTPFRIRRGVTDSRTRNADLWAEEYSRSVSCVCSPWAVLTVNQGRNWVLPSACEGVQSAKARWDWYLEHWNQVRMAREDIQGPMDLQGTQLPCCTQYCELQCVASAGGVSPCV